MCRPHVVPVAEDADAIPSKPVEVTLLSPPDGKAANSRLYSTLTCASPRKLADGQSSIPSIPSPLSFVPDVRGLQTALYSAPTQVEDTLMDQFQWLIQALRLPAVVVSCVAKRDHRVNNVFIDNWENCLGYSIEDAVADKITVEEFEQTDPLIINVHRTALNQHAMFRLPPSVAAGIERRFAATGNGPSKEQRQGAHVELDAWLEGVLPHVHVEGRTAPITIDDVVLVDLLLFNGAYFPQIHNDIEWTVFQGHGFQAWHLLENDNEELGNLFLFQLNRDKWQVPIVRPVVLRSDNGTACCVHANDSGDDPQILERHEFFKDMGLRARYAGCKPGDTLIFGLQTLHMSDPRPMPEGFRPRRAFNMRVVLREPDGSIKVNLKSDLGSYLRWQGYTVRKRINELLCQQAADGVSSEMGYLHNVGRYDFI